MKTLYILSKEKLLKIILLALKSQNWNNLNSQLIAKISMHDRWRRFFSSKGHNASIHYGHVWSTCEPKLYPWLTWCTGAVHQRAASSRSQHWSLHSCKQQRTLNRPFRLCEHINHQKCSQSAKRNKNPETHIYFLHYGMG